MKKKIRYYRLLWIKHDLPAGLSVFLVALPLCLGIALASGAPLYSGILSGIIGGMVVSLVSGSPLAVSGPAAGLTTVVAASILFLGGFEVFLLAVIVMTNPTSGEADSLTCFNLTVSAKNFTTSISIHQELPYSLPQFHWQQ